MVQSVQDRSAREAAMQQAAPQLRFATTRLASGPLIHFAFDDAAELWRITAPTLREA
jgi:hypothetical protein